MVLTDGANDDSRMIAGNEFGTLTLELVNWPEVITCNHEKPEVCSGKSFRCLSQ